MIDFLKQYSTEITTLIAILAFFRPEIGKLRKRFMGKLDFHPRPNVIVGYTYFGPRFSIDGCMESIGRDHLVKNICIKIVRKKDKSEHNFIWELWESPIIGKESGNALPSYAFPLKNDVPFSGIFTFGDQEARSIFLNDLSDLSKDFYEFIVSQYPAESKEPNFDFIKTFDEFVGYENGTHKKDVIGSKKYLAVYDLMDKEFYWKEGAFSVELNIITTRPDRTYKFSFEFSLNAKDSKELRLNITSSIKDMCRLYKTPYYYQAKPKINNFTSAD